MNQPKKAPEARLLPPAAMLLSLGLCLSACGPTEPVAPGGSGGAASDGAGGAAASIGGSPSGGQSAGVGGANTGGSGGSATGGTSGGVSSGGANLGAGGSTGGGSSGGDSGTGGAPIDAELLEQIQQFCGQDCTAQLALDCQYIAGCFGDCLEVLSAYASPCADEVGATLTCIEDHPEYIDYRCEEDVLVPADPEVCRAVQDAVYACWDELFGQDTRP